jgi:hypothetical protein
MNPLKLIFITALFLFAGVVQGKKDKNNDAKESSIEGYIHTLWDYDFSEDAIPNNEFQIRRAQVKFKNSISTNIFTTLEIGFEENQFAPKDVYLEYKANSLFNLLIGQHKMPFSREELRSTSELLVVDRGEVNDIFGDYGYLGRDIGISLNGGIFKNKFPIDYTFGVFNGNGYKVGGDNNSAKDFAERIILTPIKDLSIGMNFAQKNDSISGEVIMASGGDFSYQKGRFTFEGEILYGGIDTANTMLGYYLIGLCKIACVEPVIKFERVTPDSRETDDYLNVITYGVNWYLHKKARIQANLVTNSPSKEESYNKFLIQAQVNF